MSKQSNIFLHEYGSNQIDFYKFGLNSLTFISSATTSQSNSPSSFNVDSFNDPTYLTYWNNTSGQNTFSYLNVSSVDLPLDSGSLQLTGFSSGVTWLATVSGKIFPTHTNETTLRNYAITGGYVPILNGSADAFSNYNSNYSFTLLDQTDYITLQNYEAYPFIGKYVLGLNSGGTYKWIGYFWNESIKKNTASTSSDVALPVGSLAGASTIIVKRNNTNYLFRACEVTSFVNGAILVSMTNQQTLGTLSNVTTNTNILTGSDSFLRTKWAYTDPEDQDKLYVSFKRTNSNDRRIVLFDFLTLTDLAIVDIVGGFWDESTISVDSDYLYYLDKTKIVHVLDKNTLVEVNTYNPNLSYTNAKGIAFAKTISSNSGPPGYPSPPAGGPGGGGGSASWSDPSPYSPPGRDDTYWTRHLRMWSEGLK